MTRTQATLQILGSIARLQAASQFQPLSNTDRMAFEGASDTALHAFTSDPLLLAAIMDLEEAPDTIMTEGGQALQVIVSDQRIELHGCTVTGEPIAFGFDLTNLI